jgi:DNA/RNA endonuclease G (NUC1)
MNSLEREITNKAKRREVRITHILSIPIYENDEISPKTHYKVVLYEKASGETESECYVLHDDNKRRNARRKLSLRDVERQTGLALSNGSM